MRFVIKTMEVDEAAALQRMLPAYLNYVRRNRDTLIIRFFACMSLRLYRHTLYFVVMENIFPTKGSWWCCGEACHSCVRFAQLRDDGCDSIHVPE
jgi:hypothetical protein